MSKIKKLLEEINEVDNKENTFFQTVEKVFGIKLLKDGVLSTEQFKKHNVNVDPENKYRISFNCPSASLSRNMSKRDLRLTPDKLKILSDNNMTVQFFSEEDGLSVDVGMI